MIEQLKELRAVVQEAYDLATRIETNGGTSAGALPALRQIGANLDSKLKSVAAPTKAAPISKVTTPKKK